MRRAGAVAACLALVTLAACTRRAATEPPPTEIDPAAHWSAYAIATGERRYELRVRIQGSARLGEGFVQALAALTPPPPGVAPGAERDLPLDVELVASLSASIAADGDARVVTMTYNDLRGHVDVAGVRKEVAAADLAAMRGGTRSFAYRMAPDGSTTPVAVPPSAVPPSAVPPGSGPATTATPPTTTAATVAGQAPVPRGLDLSCPAPPPGGADPGQYWKIAEPIPLFGAAGTLLATNGYTLEGDNSAVMSSRIDAPLDTAVGMAELAAANPVLAALGGPAAPAKANVGGNVVTTTTCELTWPEQELLARTLTGHQRLVFSFPAQVGPPTALLGPGQFVIFDYDVDGELRSV